MLDMKYLLPFLILIDCPKIQGIFEWTVVGKVTEYGQNVTLFCNVSNCCPKDSGWDMWIPQQRTLFIDVKTGRPNKKYDGKVLKDGYTLIIQNLTETDLNVSYSCLYGVTFGEIQLLLKKDVFTSRITTPPNVSTSNSKLSEGEIVSIITGTTMAIVLVSVFIHFFIKRHKKQDTEYNCEETPKATSETTPCIEKEEPSDLKDNKIKMEIEHEEVIPRNIRDQINKQINNWEEKDKMFVTTRASEYVTKCLQESSCLTVTGPSGVGKSFVARHTALVLQKEGYKIIPVRKPDDIEAYYQAGKRTVFLVDDICGNFTANQQQIENWKQLLPLINTIIADECCNIIVSCRLQVYNDDKFNLLVPFKSCECNLISDKLCLTSAEKKLMVTKYIGSNLEDLDISARNNYLFPLLCSLYDGGKHGSVKEFFKNPFFVYQSELDSLSRHGDDGNYKLCSLALLVLFNNQMKEKWFQGKVTDEQRPIIEDTCGACRLNRSTSKEELKEAILTLEGTFVQKQNGVYRTVHDKLFDFLAHYFGQKMIECLIDHGDTDLVHERFIWRKSPDDQNSMIDFIIEIPDFYFELYLERFIKDWSAGNVRVIFENKNMEIPLFRQQLLQHLKQLDKSQQYTFASANDTVLPKDHFGSGDTPLIRACYHGYTDIVQWTFQNGVDVNQCGDNGGTGLFMASQNGHTDIVKLLLERNPNINQCENNGSSPLFQASQEGHTAIVELLLERNPNINLCGNNGCSPLFQASQNGHTEIVKLLLERKTKIDLCNNQGCSPLLMVSQNGHTDIVKLLLERNPCIDLCSKRTGCSPLYYASQNGHTEIVKLLLERNANIDLCDNDGWSPLRQASMYGYTEIVKLLLERNPNIDQCDNDGCSPLYIASLNGHTQVVKLLLEKNSNVDLCDNDCCSPLDKASQNGHTDVIRLLSEKNYKC